jgi:hypothetical protein
MKAPGTSINSHFACFQSDAKIASLKKADLIGQPRNPRHEATEARVRAPRQRGVEWRDRSGQQLPRPWNAKGFVRSPPSYRGRITSVGRNTLRGSGPDQKSAVDAVAHVGCPERRVDRSALRTVCPPNVHSASNVDAIIRKENSTQNAAPDVRRRRAIVTTEGPLEIRQVSKADIVSD